MMLTALCLLALSSVHAGPVVPEDFHSLVNISDARWSPVDDRIVFVTRVSNEKQRGYDKNLWLIRADGSVLRQLTHNEAVDCAPRWSEDGREILFLSARSGKPAAWILPADGGEAHRVSDFELNVAKLEWVPGHREISFVARVPEDWEPGPRDCGNMKPGPDPLLEEGVRVIRDALYRSHGSYFDGLRPHLFTLDLESGDILQLTSGESSVSDYAWRPDGRQVAVLESRLGGTLKGQLGRIVLMDRQGNKKRTLDWQDMITPGITWQPDGNHILFSIWNPNGLDRSYLVNVATGKRHELAPAPDREFGGFRWTRDGKHLVALCGERGEVHLWRIDPRSGRGKRVTSGARQLGVHSQMFFPLTLSLAPDGKRAVCSQTRSDWPTELVVVDLESGKISPLTDINRRWCEARTLVAAEKFQYRLKNGQRLDAWVIPPAGLRRGKKYPLVMEIHGGPWTMYGEHFMPEFQILAGAGMGVLYVNFRGSSGYGKASKQFVVNNMTGPYEDLMSGVDAALERFGWADPGRLGVAGGSYGGEMTAWIIGQTSRFKAAVPMRGVYDQVTQSLSWDLPSINPYFLKPDPWEDPGVYWAKSPLGHANRVETPTLIIHSENDFRCPISGAEQYFMALKMHGVPVEMVRYAGECHGLSRGGRPDRLVDRLQRIRDWMKRWLKP